MRGFLVAAGAALFLSACAVTGDAVTGSASPGFVTPAAGQAFLLLDPQSFEVRDWHGAGVVVATGIAVTNAHNRPFVGQAGVAATDIIGESRDYDLLFFHTARGTPMPQGVPRVDQDVIAYGNALGLREVRAKLLSIAVPIPPRCAGCAPQTALGFRADGGHGFSGGPVIDAASGSLIGITFGFSDKADGADGRIMYAYDIALVMRELSIVQGRRP